MRNRGPSKEHRHEASFERAVDRDSTAFRSIPSRRPSSLRVYRLGSIWQNVDVLRRSTSFSLACATTSVLIAVVLCACGLALPTNATGSASGGGSVPIPANSKKCRDDWIYGDTTGPPLGAPPADVGAACNDGKAPTNCIHDKWIVFDGTCVCTAACNDVHVAKGSACGSSGFVCHTAVHGGGAIDLCVKDAWGICVDDAVSETPAGAPNCTTRGGSCSGGPPCCFECDKETNECQ